MVVAKGWEEGREELLLNGYKLFSPARGPSPRDLLYNIVHGVTMLCCILRHVLIGWISCYMFFTTMIF